MIKFYLHVMISYNAITNIFCNTILLRNKIKSKFVDGVMKEKFILLSLNHFGGISIYANTVSFSQGMT